MSSYLSFYVVPKRKSKEEPKDYVILTSYSRNTELYRVFNETVNPVFLGYGEIQYTTLTKEHMAQIKEEFESEIKKCKDRLETYEKYATGNPDYINEILDLREYIEDLNFWKDKSSFIQDLIQDLEFYDDGIEEVCCNIS